MDLPYILKYSLYQKLNKNIHITGILQIPTSNTYTFNKIPFELVNANVTDKDIHFVPRAAFLAVASGVAFRLT